MVQVILQNAAQYAFGPSLGYVLALEITINCVIAAHQPGNFRPGKVVLAFEVFEQFPYQIGRHHVAAARPVVGRLAAVAGQGGWAPDDDTVAAVRVVVDFLVELLAAAASTQTNRLTPSNGHAQSPGTHTIENVLGIFVLHVVANHSNALELPAGNDGLVCMMALTTISSNSPAITLSINTSILASQGTKLQHPCTVEPILGATLLVRKLKAACGFLLFSQLLYKLLPGKQCILLFMVLFMKYYCWCL